jgi:flagellar motor switch protein FliM
LSGQAARPNWARRFRCGHSVDGAGRKAWLTLCCDKHGAKAGQKAVRDVRSRRDVGDETQGRRRAPSARVAGDDAARAWYATLPRAADDHLGIELSILSVQEGVAHGETLVSDLATDCLLLLMRDGQGRRGLCALDPAFLAAIIEAQMTGRIGTAPLAPRRPTATDAAIASGLVDAICAAFDAAVAECAPPPPWRGARVAGFLPDARAALMTLPEGPLHRAGIVADLGAGARRGLLTLVMPPAQGPVAARAGRAARRTLGQELRPVVAEGRVTLEAVLHRLRMPLARIGALAPGDLIPVPATALNAISIEGADGRRVSGARLGQLDGRKAVRIILPQNATPVAGPPRRPLATAPAANDRDAARDADLPLPTG